MGLVQNKLSGCSGVLLNSQLLLLSFSLSIYVFLNFCIFLFHHLWLYFSFWYLLGSLFGRYLTAWHLNLLCLCAEKHHHSSLSSHFTLSVSIFLLICTYYPPLSICFWSSTGDRLEIMKWSIEPESSLNFPSRRPGWFTKQKVQTLAWALWNWYSSVWCWARNVLGKPFLRGFLFSLTERIWKHPIIRYHFEN